MARYLSVGYTYSYIYLNSPMQQSEGKMYSKRYHRVTSSLQSLESWAPLKLA